MPTIRTPMTELENCIICGAGIDKGNDPAICKEKRCEALYKYELCLNKCPCERCTGLKTESFYEDEK
jgi:hypothetical protein